MRVGVYSDLLYREHEGTVSTDLSFVRLVASLPPRVSEVVVFGRLHPEPGREPYALPHDGVRFVPLPYYPSVWAAGAVARSVAGSCRTLARELEGLDALWLFGPNPLVLPFALVARARGVPLALGVRQDYPAYVAARAPGSRRWPAIAAAHALERSFRLLARRAPTVALGEELARSYRGGRAGVLATGFSLVRAGDVVPLDEALARSWDGELRLLTVGRLDAEKNPLLLPEIVARLDARWHLTVVGEGPLREEVLRHAREAGASDRIELVGHVENGPPLWERYRSSHAFLHVSLTEGLPQVLFEAQAAGLPVVATDVGGVRAGFAGSALVVPARDPAAAAAALARLAADSRLRAELIRSSIEHARVETLDAQLDRIVAFLRSELEV
jgi:glycosyltransferase involved in cell wall biosynthesis